MSNPFAKARYVLSAHELAQLPIDQGVEIAFAGRSNAGKSSALNAITGQSGLARTSKTPGRTQQLNVFALDDTRRLIDLPGYGYAQVSAELRDRWRRIIDVYLRTRHALVGIVLIMDSRHPFQEFDRHMLGFCREMGLACHCLLTKADKLSHSQALKTLAEVERELKLLGNTASAQLFSATKKQGIEQARTQLITLLNA